MLFTGKITDKNIQRIMDSSHIKISSYNRQATETSQSTIYAAAL